MNGKVPTSRTINGKALTGNITLTATDVGAAPTNHTHSNATTASAGFLTALDKQWIDGRLRRRYIYGADSSTTTENGYYKIATYNTSSTYRTGVLNLRIWSDNFVNFAQSPVNVTIVYRTNSNSATYTNVWTYIDNPFNYSKIAELIYIKYPSSDNTGVCTVYFHRNAAYQRIVVDVLGEAFRGAASSDSNYQKAWTFFANSTVESTITQTGYTVKTIDELRQVGSRDTEFAGTLSLTKTTDLSGTGTASPALKIGDMDGTHLEIDGNEIHAKSSENKTGILNLNNDGGVVHIGSGGLTVSGDVEATTFHGNLTGLATTATRATSDSRGQNIADTYIKALSVRGRTITYTKGDGGTGTITTQDTNTDTKATLTNTTTNAEYRLVLSTSANDTTETNTLRKNTNFRANPGTGAFYAKGYRRINITGQTVNLNNYNLSDGAIHVMGFIETTNGGAAKITNAPLEDSPFILDVELIRWASTTDYVTLQTFKSVANLNVEYTRRCTSGTWTSWVSRPLAGTTLSSLGVTATAAELNKLDGCTASVKELNYVDGVTSNIQNQLNGKLSTTGTAAKATKLATARTITLSGDASGSTTFDGSKNITLSVTVKDDSHNHLIANVDGLQTALDSKMGLSILTDQSLDVTRAPGFYYAAGANSVTGKPSGVDAFGLNVYRIASGYIRQELMPAGNNLQGVRYTRVFQGDDTWTDWKFIPTFLSNPTSGQVIVADNNGQLKSSGFTIAKSVPSDAKFTDTTYTLSSFGITATAAELNKLDGVTATAAELNYVDGVTSNIQTQLNGKAPSSHTHKYAGSTSAGGAANSATKLATARTISLTGDVTGSTTFDGSANKSITCTVANNSHTHTAGNITSGTLATGVKATNSTDYTTSRLRNIRFGTSVPSSLSNGEVFFVYE